jgi:thioredoxin-like negative regulator of GroEL
MPVVNITSSNANIFCKALKNNTFVCLYHWHDCRHCVELLPIWRNAAKKAGKNTYIAEIELDNMKYLDKPYKDVQGFPSIVVYNNGIKIKELDKERSLKNLEKFIKENKK